MGFGFVLIFWEEGTVFVYIRDYFCIQRPWQCSGLRILICKKNTTYYLSKSWRFFFFCGDHTVWCQGWLLSLCSGIIHSGLGGPYVVPRIKPGSYMCKTNSFPLYFLSPLLIFSVDRQDCRPRTARVPWMDQEVISKVPGCKIKIDKLWDLPRHHNSKPTYAGPNRDLRRPQWWWVPWPYGGCSPSWPLWTDCVYSACHQNIGVHDPCFQCCRGHFR